MDPAKVQPEKAAKVPRTPRQVKLYWPREKADLWQEFLEICKRDGHSASAEVLAFVDEQVRKRRPGNPQRPLDAYKTEACGHVFAWVPIPGHRGLSWVRCGLCGAKRGLELPPV